MGLDDDELARRGGGAAEREQAKSRKCCESAHAESPHLKDRISAVPKGKTIQSTILTFDFRLFWPDQRGPA